MTERAATETPTPRSETKSGTDAPRPGPAGPSDRPEDSIGYIIRDTHLAFGKFLRNRLTPHKVTLGQWFFLRALWQEEGLSQRELSRRVRTTEPTTVSALRLLERNGLIRRVRNRDDRRTMNIYLTQHGRALKEHLLPVALEVNEVAAASLSAAELRQLNGLLVKMRDAVAEATDLQSDD